MVTLFPVTTEGLVSRHASYVFLHVPDGHEQQTRCDWWCECELGRIGEPALEPTMPPDARAWGGIVGEHVTEPNQAFSASRIWVRAFHSSAPQYGQAWIPLAGKL